MSYEFEQLRSVKNQNRYLNIFLLPTKIQHSLIDYLPTNGIIFIDEISRVQEMNDSLEKEEAEWYTSLLSEGKIIHDVKLSHQSTRTYYRNQTIHYLFFFIFTACTKYESTKYY